ncbi:MAG: NADH:ubiquinone reductase (Na(+)-transporting) subunit D [Bacteroidetes bacterium]|jgi:Na+-transporting NADH:ubiquinone oxidoreductase subunit D|nr:NADH:ubiquinone reductase (Na(+)-transporting) subunit D [Bacteroidota bacterium]MDA0930546.1 NADH:ubiquinone reductase (Na(+)-transporting) subunit D [Bacteroidota bacterium]
MSTETIAAVKERKPLFTAKDRKLITDPLDDDNPITVQVLGICSALAVTVQVKPALFMSMGVLFVLIMGNLVVSLIRNLIPSRVRIIVQLVIVAALVTVVDQVLKAYAYDVSKELSVFVGLIITNCIVMGRLEAFALANKPGPAILDGIGNGLGYSFILLLVAVVRELFGSGTILGFPIIGEWALNLGYKHNGLFVLPPMALVIVGVIIWVQRSRNQKLIEAN